MVNVIDAREAIYATFVAAWGTTSALTLDGEAFSPPAGAPFVRLAVRHTGSQQESLGDVGNRKFNRVGSVFVQVFAPKDQGARVADQLAHAARAILEGTHFSGSDIRIFAAATRELGPDEDGYYQVNVEAAFDYTERK